jgi:acetyltransferase-like isoleucine patch superfamily enzyme
MERDSRKSSNQINPFKTEYYTGKVLKTFGFKAIGENVKIAKNCTISGISNISIGNNVIIDAFCSIIATEKGQLTIGSFIHIGSFCHLLAAGGGIELKDFSGLSQDVKVYAKTDDYSGQSLTNPTVPEKYKFVKNGKVIINEHVIIGSGSVILPNVEIGEGTAVGALALITSNLGSWTIYVGNPLKKLSKRSKSLLEKKEEFLDELTKQHK